MREYLNLFSPLAFSSSEELEESSGKMFACSSLTLDVGLARPRPLPHP